MNIHGIRLCRFRGFLESTAIALKPLTVLLGPNSSGKSAFGHAAAAMAHAQWLHSGSSQATLTPKNARDADDWPVDLGSFADLRTIGTTGAVKIALLTASGWTDFGFGNLDSIPDLRLSRIESPSGPTASAVEMPATDLIPSPPSASSDTGRGKIASVEPATGTVLTRLNEVQWKDEVLVQLDGLIPLGAQERTGTSIPISRDSNLSITRWLQNLTYLRATRKRATRGYEQGEGARQKLGYSGEFATSVLFREGSKKVSFFSPPRISQPRSVNHVTLDPEWRLSAETTVEQATSSWFSYLGLASQIQVLESTRYPGRLDARITLRSGLQSHDITEVGFGLSQVLPIIVAGLTQSSEGLLVVDLPEAHLHARPQAALADFFCSLALAGVFVLVETHSEMFFHRLRLRAALNETLMNKICVYFLDPPMEDGLCGPPREIQLDSEGELKWPPGFLQEAWEMEISITAARKARGQRQG
jgi:hypothetical protein